ncbi:MAG: ABC transporter ATP-binding protein [bacterium]
MLEMDSVRYRVDDTTILKGVDFDLHQGEFVSLIGPNGSGKSTSIHCLAGLIQPTEGEVRLENKSLTQYSREEIARKISMVGQEMTVNFDFTVHEIVMMGRSPYQALFERGREEDRRIVREALEEVSMNRFANRQFRTLSGGEKQRVLIARCLAQEADVLLLDEPTNHLDVKHTLHFLDLLQRIDASVVLAIHDLNLAARYSDRIYLLDDGKVVDHGSPRQVFRQSKLETVFGRDVTIDEEPRSGRPRVSFHPCESTVG